MDNVKSKFEDKRYSDILYLVTEIKKEYPDREYEEIFNATQSAVSQPHIPSISEIRQIIKSYLEWGEWHEQFC